MSPTPRTGRSSLLGLILAATLLSAHLHVHADSVTQLVGILSRAKDYKQRLAALIGLTRLKDRRAVPALIKALGDPHKTVRGAAARALGALGDQRARPALEALLLRSKDDYVRGQAQSALSALMARTEPGGTRRPDQMLVQGTLGTMDREAAQEVVDARIDRARACLAQRLATAPYLGGTMVLKFRVTTGGKVKWVRPMQSDVGSTEVEACILREMASATFEPPKGGEAEVSVPVKVDGRMTVATLDPAGSVAAGVLRRNCKKLLRVGKKKRPPPGLQAVLYLNPYGDVLYAGLSAGGAEIPAELAEGIVAKLKKLQLQDPALDGRWGKLVYRFSCQGR